MKPLWRVRIHLELVEADGFVTEKFDLEAPFAWRDAAREYLDSILRPAQHIARAVAAAREESGERV